MISIPRKIKCHYNSALLTETKKVQIYQNVCGETNKYIV